MDKHEVFGEVIFSYTRKQAIEDGVLVDISRAPATIEAGIRMPVAVTEAVFHILNPDDELKRQGQSLEGRLWDLWMIFRSEVKKAGTDKDEVHFAPLFLLKDHKEPVPVKMWSKCGPGNNAEPVLTIMLEGED